MCFLIENSEVYEEDSNPGKPATPLSAHIGLSGRAKMDENGGNILHKWHRRVLSGCSASWCPHLSARVGAFESKHVNTQFAFENIDWF